MYGDHASNGLGVTCFSVICIGLVLGWLFKGLITGSIDLDYLYEAIIYARAFIG